MYHIPKDDFNDLLHELEDLRYWAYVSNHQEAYRIYNEMIKGLKDLVDRR